MKIAIIIPHMFMHNEVIDEVIFAPGKLGADLASGLSSLGHHITLFTPGYTQNGVINRNADLTLFDNELAQRGYGYTDLLKKHPLLFISMARQAQAELIADAFMRANNGEFDLIHVYTNEEETALVFAKFCKIPVIFTHHEPFNYLAKYRSSFPKYSQLPWLSISLSQRKTMPENTNFVGNIYHGIAHDTFQAIQTPTLDYIAYFGRIIEPKGVHLAIEAAKKAGVKLKIAGKHYAGYGKDEYWSEVIQPQIDGESVEYVGFLSKDFDKNEFLGNAKALLVPSTWDEPFGMVMIESLACSTPVIGLDSGSIPEVIDHNITGFVVTKSEQDTETVTRIVDAINNIDAIERMMCRKQFEKRFTLKRMCLEHVGAYVSLLSESSISS